MIGHIKSREVPHLYKCRKYLKYAALIVATTILMWGVSQLTGLFQNGFCQTLNAVFSIVFVLMLTIVTPLFTLLMSGFSAFMAIKAIRAGEDKRKCITMLILSVIVFILSVTFSAVVVYAVTKGIAHQ